MAADSDLRTLQVWDLPVRITHWTNVLSILGLSITGYYIGQPFIFTLGPAAGQFLMGSVRFVHFLLAFVFTVGVLFRIYWAFAGNRWAGWRELLPTSRDRLAQLRAQGGYYVFLRRHPPKEIGHHPLAGITYTGLYVPFMLQIVTGFALYSQGFESGSFWVTAFGWIVTTVGAPELRLTHTIIMWMIIAFTIHHVYSAVLIDSEERSGLVSSIVTGNKTHIDEALRHD